ncbi:MAG: hypothetical protein R3324_20490, partial [Halobacteriales archaeon]|nr:hypothetical protein [Halobacteriales archaeon]
VFCGISSGANIEGAVKVAEAQGLDSIATIICDTGMRYFSTKLFEDEYEIVVHDRDHPFDQRSIDVLETYQDGWTILD